jgi:hypothetical protein
MTYNRVNEDYLDAEELEAISQKNDVIYEDVHENVFKVIRGERPDINLCSLPDAYYRFDDNDDFLDFCAKVRVVVEWPRQPLFRENANMNWIDVSNITDFTYAFRGLKHTIDISRWDVSNAETFDCMFRYSKFNGNIGDWDVRNVRNFSHMFAFSTFAGDISGWQVSDDADVTGMFDYDNEIDAFHVPTVIRKDARRWTKTGIR